MTATSKKAATKKPAAKKQPATKQPATKQPATKQAATKKPAAKALAAKAPAAKAPAGAPPQAVGAFTGFSAGTLRFLAGLEANNNKAWFDAHRDDYEASLVEPAKRFVAAIGERLQRFAPGIRAEPRVNGSIFRLNRDVRFSKDKTPYKAHLDLWFWEGEERGWDCPGFFFRLTPDRLILGAGMHKFTPELLARYRAAVVDSKRGQALAKAVDEVRARGPYTLGGKRYKTTPRGFDPAHARAELLLHDGLVAMSDTPHPDDLATGAFADSCARRFRDLAPLHAWLSTLRRDADVQ